MGKKDDKLRTIENAVRAIEKQFGSGAIMQLGDTPRGELASISLGTLGIDLALGIGGLPRGRIVEVFGHESSGKTTLALHAIAEAQRSGGLCAFVDAEHALDPIYAQALGVALDRLWVAQPDSGEQALEICEMLARSGGVDLIVVDSVAALVPRAEIEGEMGDAHMGLQARLMSQALRKLTSVAAKTESTILFINQIRQKIDPKNANKDSHRWTTFYGNVDIAVAEAVMHTTIQHINAITELREIKFGRLCSRRCRSTCSRSSSTATRLHQRHHDRSIGSRPMIFWIRPQSRLGPRQQHP